MAQITDEQSRWRDEPWAWLVLGLPVAAVIACLTTIYIAVVTSDGLVVDDYYKQGLEINRVLDREAEAERLGLVLSNLEQDADGTHFLLRAVEPQTLPAMLEVQFLHATREAGDRRHQALHLGDGLYRVTHATLAPGPWYLDISTADWRVVSRFIVPAG